jgi:hypothetical protein
MASLLEKRRLKALAEGKQMPVLTLSVDLSSPEKLTQNNIDIIRREYLELKQFYTQTELEKEKIVTEIKDTDCEKLMSGARKTARKCIKYNIVELSSTIQLQLSVEVLNHIRILRLLFEFSKSKNLEFNIPRIYLHPEIYTTYNMNRYFLDYVDIDMTSIKLAKFHNFINPNILKNIGNLIGEYAKKYNVLLHDFELYINKNDGLPTLLDFGETRKIDDTISQTTYTKFIYDGIIETYELLKTKNILSNDMSAEEYLEKRKYYHMKYLKYKQKYLELKRNISIE